VQKEALPLSLRPSYARASCSRSPRARSVWLAGLRGALQTLRAAADGMIWSLTRLYLVQVILLSLKCVSVG